MQKSAYTILLKSMHFLHKTSVYSIFANILHFAFLKEPLYQILPDLEIKLHFGATGRNPRR